MVPCLDSVTQAEVEALCRQLYHAVRQDTACLTCVRCCCHSTQSTATATCITTLTHAITSPVVPRKLQQKSQTFSEKLH